MTPNTKELVRKEPTAVHLPDTREIDTKALSAVESARGLVVKDQNEYGHAADFLQGLKAIEKAIDETFDPIIQANHNAWKTSLAGKAKHAEPVQEAERIVKAKMIGFQQTEEKRLRAEGERLRKEAQKADEEERLGAGILTNH